MVVKRIVIDIATTSVAETRAFYEEIFDLSAIMDQGWIVTLSSDESNRVQVSIASQGGSGAPVPDATIEVDDVDDVYRRVQAGNHMVEYEITDEPWGVRRFFVRDPAGKLLNVLAHC